VRKIDVVMGNKIRELVEVRDKGPHSYEYVQLSLLKACDGIQGTFPCFFLSSHKHSPPQIPCQRYSAPQSPIRVIIFRPFERSRTASISVRSASERRNLNAFRLSSGCSETPRRVPFRKDRSKIWCRKRFGEMSQIGRTNWTHRRERHRRMGGPVPIEPLYWRCSPRHGGRRFAVTR
jgi:hypothetical protein